MRPTVKKSALVSAVMAVALLAGCGNDQVEVAKVHHRTHFSPPYVPPPLWPSDVFDEAKAKAQFDLARAARDKGEWTEARAAAEAGLALWPVEIEGWETLMAACDAQEDVACQHYADFYHAKLLALNGLPMRAAALGFETVAENEVGQHVDNFTYDKKTLDMATRLWVFCTQHDSVRNPTAEPTEASLDEDYPYVPALLVIGVGAGILTGIKSVAK
jgi:hypothetical protein